MLRCLSISFKKAPLSVREKVALSRDEILLFFKNMKESCVILSTCNRMEIYFEGSFFDIENILAQIKEISREEFVNYERTYSDYSAIRHLARVACGMDSMVLGEDEILRQIKEAYYLAFEHKKTNYEMNVIFQKILQSSKDIKTNTGLSSTPVSIGTLVVNASAHFKEGTKTVLLMGITGKIGNIVAKNLLSKKDISLMATMRKHSFKGLQGYHDIQMIPFQDRYQGIEKADVIISATTSPHYTLTKNEWKQHVIKDKKRLLIDLAVPSDLDPELASCSNVQLMNIDDFKRLAIQNNEIKKQYAQDADILIDQWVEEIQKELRMHDVIQLLPILNEDIQKGGIQHLLFSLREYTNYHQMNEIIKWLEDYVKGRM